MTGEVVEVKSKADVKLTDPHKNGWNAGPQSSRGTGRWDCEGVAGFSKCPPSVILQ